MGEIKSTLDLVMERTRHLSLSEEERTHQHRTAFHKRLQGLLQQHADDAITVDVLKDRIVSLQAELDVKDRHALITGIGDRIDPDRDNRRWLELLGEMAPDVCKPLATVLADHSQRRRARLREGEDRLRQHLISENDIAGTAVVPNPLKDRDCRADLAALRQETRDRLAAIVGSDAPVDQT